jgi:hypothetical protein
LDTREVIYSLNIRQNADVLFRVGKVRVESAEGLPEAGISMRT